MPGLRERNKERTRAHISQVATDLFKQRGFDQVTVAQIAEAAEVSKMTVFNYFPRKEDLLLDRGPEALALISQTVREREGATTALQALRALALSLAEQRHPFSGLGGEGFFPLVRTIVASPALLARVREMTGELEATLAGLLAEDEVEDEDVSDPQLLAALTVAAYRTVHNTTTAHRLDGQDLADAAADHTRRLHQAFDALEAATRPH